MIDLDRISKLKRYLSDWKAWGAAAAAERDRLLELDTSRRDANDNDVATSELLQRRIQGLDDVTRAYQSAELRIATALARAEAGQD